MPQGLDPKFDSEKWPAESIHKFYVEKKTNAGQKQSVFRISGDAVVKRVYGDSEIIVMKLVLKTEILTPGLLAHVKHTRYSYAVLEYIEGQTVADAWKLMPSEQKKSVIKTLHDYVTRLQQIKDDHSSTPGPLGRTSLACDAFQFGHKAKGPFEDSAELVGFLNERLDLINPKRPKPLDPFHGEWPLVLTHNDLNMTNVMIDNDRKVWLLDWGRAGYYPQYFEQYAMIHTMPGLKQPEDWAAAIQEITGDYPEEMEKLDSIQVTMYWS